MRSVFVKFDTLTLSPGNQARTRSVNIAVMRIPEMPGKKVEFERWEMVARQANLERFGYNHGMEDEVLRKWPNNGLDRMGQYD